MNKWALAALGVLALLFATGLIVIPSILARAIASAEGFGLPGAIPTVRNNPGDLKLGGDSITSFPTKSAGWAALMRQLALIASGQSAYYTPAMTLREFAQTWTATEQSAWANNVLAYLRDHGHAAATLDTPISTFL